MNYLYCLVGGVTDDSALTLELLAALLTPYHRSRHVVLLGMNYMNLNKNLKSNQGAMFYHGNAIVLNILNAGLNVNTGRGRVNWLGFYVGGGDNNATWWRSWVRNGHKLNRAIVLTVVWDFDPLVSTEQKCYIWTEEVLFGK